MTLPRETSIIILIPVFNDWQSLRLLLPEIDTTLAAHAIVAEVIVIDDASTTRADRAELPPALSAITRLGILRLRRNLGHQRAIAIGLAFVQANRPPALVVIMDGDGEDRPRDIPHLVDTCVASGGGTIVFAERTKRSESVLFRVFYQLYRLLHRILTGHGVKVGNFSVVPPPALASIVAVSELWNHYAAAVVKARLPRTSVSTTRGSRMAGQPTMKFTALVVHGLSALAVFGDVVGVRMLVATLTLSLVAVSALATVIAIRLGTTFAIPGWATYTVGILLLLLLQMAVAGFLVSLGILANRSSFTFVPLRDYTYFVQSYEAVQSV
jgi:hypothetical protein